MTTTYDQLRAAVLAKTSEVNEDMLTQAAKDLDAGKSAATSEAVNAVFQVLK